MPSPISNPPDQTRWVVHQLFAAVTQHLTTGQRRFTNREIDEAQKELAHAQERLNELAAILKEVPDERANPGDTGS